MICHITNKETWNKSLTRKYFRTDSLDTEGFIHCSPAEKILQVADNYYKGQSDLLILFIDESKVSCKIIREDLYGHGYEFPHIYGELDMQAIIAVKELLSNGDGCFIFPEGL